MQAQAKAQEHTITITVKNGVFDYKDQNGINAKEKHANRSESIGWVTKEKQEFTIHDFKYKKPDGTDVSAWPFSGSPRPLTSSGGVIPPQTVSDQALLKTRYKYTVTMPPGSSNSDDPEIIIDL